MSVLCILGINSHHAFGEYCIYPDKSSVLNLVSAWNNPDAYNIVGQKIQLLVPYRNGDYVFEIK